MDKNNDIQVNKVDKWCEGVADVSLWRAKKSVDMFLCGYSPMLSIEALDAVRTIYVYLDEALDRFNELEARHQKDTGMISEYEEGNRILREQRTKLTDARNKLAEDNENLKDESFKYSYRLDKLGQALEERGIYCRWFEAEMGWHLYEGKTMDDLKQHYEEELRIREKEKDEKDKLIDELNQMVKDLESKNKSLDLKYRLNRSFGFYGINGPYEKIKKLEKENTDLKMTLAMCERDANMAKELCHTVAFNAERARNKTPWFAQASPDSRYLSKPGDDI